MPGVTRRPPRQNDELSAAPYERMRERPPDKASTSTNDDAHNDRMPEERRALPDFRGGRIRPMENSATLGFTRRISPRSGAAMRRISPRSRSLFVVFWMLAGLLGTACKKQKTVAEAESQNDIEWLTANPNGDSIAALGRLADREPRAVAVLEARANDDLNVHIAAWSAVTRKAAWGTTFVKSSLANPVRAEMAASALPRSDPRLLPFLADLENAIVRLSAGKRGVVIAGILASVNTEARSAVERRLLDPKTRGVMCHGIGLPEASAESKSVLLTVPAEARDHPACVSTVIALAADEQIVLDWISTSAEPGFLGAAAQSDLPCPRLASIWEKALSERNPESHSALTVSLTRSIERCPAPMDPVLGELLAKSPRARSAIVQAIDPYGTELPSLKETCTALARGYANGEGARVRARAREALNRGCAHVL